MTSPVESRLSGYDRAAVNGLLADFIWLLEQHPEHRNDYTDWREEQIRRLLEEAYGE